MTQIRETAGSVRQDARDGRPGSSTGPLCPGFGSWLPPRSVGPTPRHTPRALGPGFPTPPHTPPQGSGPAPGFSQTKQRTWSVGGGRPKPQSPCLATTPGTEAGRGGRSCAQRTRGGSPTHFQERGTGKPRARSTLVFPPRPSVRAPPLVGGRSEFRAADAASQATDTPRGQRPEHLDPGAGAVLPGAWVLSFLLPAGGTLAAASALRGKPAVAAHARRSPRLSAEERGGLAPAGRAAARQVGATSHEQQTHTFVLLEVKTVSESRTRVGMKKGR